jgi:hypothetical protein
MLLAIVGAATPVGQIRSATCPHDVLAYATRSNKTREGLHVAIRQFIFSFSRPISRVQVDILQTRIVV